MSNDIRTTKYTLKPNVETTRYYTNTGEDIEEQVEENKDAIARQEQDIADIKIRLDTDENDISDLKTRMTTAEGNISTNITNISTNTTNISNLSSSVSTNTTDISNLKSRMTTAETNITNLSSSVSTNTSNISTNTSNIANLQNQINNLQLGTPFEGLFQPVYNASGATIKLNYNKGFLRYWAYGGHINCAINDTKFSEYEFNASSVILPGKVKQINQDGTVSEILENIYYTIDSGTNRKELTTLSTITTDPDVYSLNIKIQMTPSLRYFNLMEGLKELTISRSPIIRTGNGLSLTIPSSVISCSLSGIVLNNLTFISDTPASLGLTLSIIYCQINDKLTCCRTLQSGASLVSNSNYKAPNVMEVNCDFIYAMPNSNCFGSYTGRNTESTTLILRYSNVIDLPDLTWTAKSFKAVYNQTYKNQAHFANKINTNNWYN